MFHVEHSDGRVVSGRKVTCNRILVGIVPVYNNVERRVGGEVDTQPGKNAGDALKTRINAEHTACVQVALKGGEVGEKGSAGKESGYSLFYFINFTILFIYNSFRILL